MNRQRTTGRITKLALVVVTMALLGHAGHLLLEHSGHGAAHHAFHMALGTTAPLVVIGYILHDVRRNGWPAFSWRLRQSPRGTH